MISLPNTKHCNLEQVLKISRGNPEKFKTYLEQFTTLIPTRMDRLRHDLKAEDRLAVRKTVHNMSPQLQFFGIPGIGYLINKLEFEYQSIEMQDMVNLVQDILQKLTEALEEIKMILKNEN